MTDTLCVVPHAKDPQRPRAALDGLRTCPGHRTQLYVRLHVLGHAYDALAAKLQAGADGGEHVAGTAPLGLDLDPRVLRCRSEIYAYLASWCRAVHRERRLHLPPDTCAAMGPWLARQADWLCAMPTTDIGDLYAGLNAHHTTVKHLLIPTGRRRRPVGRCVETTWSDVTTRTPHRCDGTLTAAIGPADDLLPAALTCDTCGIDIPADQWGAFRRRYQRAEAEPAA